MHCTLFLFRVSILLHCLCSVLAWGKNKRKARLEAERASIEAARLSKLVVIFGMEFDKTSFYAAVSTLIVLLIALCIQVRSRGKPTQKKRVPSSEGRDDHVEEDKFLDVVIVGCGLPKKGIGWFHLMQLLQMPNVNVRAVVEPYYLDKKKCPYPPPEFVDLMGTLVEMDIQCYYHVGELEIFQQPTLCIIAGDTTENPQLFQQCVGLGATHIFLEVPGAPSIGHLREMKSFAETRGVQVYMGYQNLTAQYIEKAVALSRSIRNSHVFFCHNDTHQSTELHRVFARYPEGMLRSMASQELAILVSQYKVVANVIDKFKVNTNRLFSERTTFYNKANGAQLTDYSRVAFKITTKKGQNVSVMADRCGGLVSFAVVKNQKGEEIQRFESHDEEEVSNIRRQIREDKEMTRQFIVHSEDFLEIKRRVVQSILNGGAPMNVASIQDGIDVMTLADYCTKEINSVLKADDSF